MKETAKLYWEKAVAAAHDRGLQEGLVVGDEVFSVTELLLIAIYFQLQESSGEVVPLARTPKGDLDLVGIFPNVAS